MKTLITYSNSEDVDRAVLRFNRFLSMGHRFDMSKVVMSYKTARHSLASLELQLESALKEKDQLQEVMSASRRLSRELGDTKVNIDTDRLGDKENQIMTRIANLKTSIREEEEDLARGIQRIRKMDGTIQDLATLKAYQ